MEHSGGAGVASHQEGNREYSVAILELNNGDYESNYTHNPDLDEVEVPPVVLLRAVEAIIKWSCHSATTHNGDSREV